MVVLVLLQAGAPIIEDSHWTPSMITALFGGVVLLLGAVTQMIRELRAARKEAAAELRVAREEAAKASAVRAAKVVEVYDLVNDGNSRLLDEVKGLRQRVADLTVGTQAGDQAQKDADEAQHNVERKAAVTAAAAAMRAVAESPKE